MSSLIMEDSRAKKRKPLGMNEMKSALTRAKTDFAEKFTADDFIRIFNFIDDNGSGKISLFEFVEGIRVSVCMCVCVRVALNTFSIRTTMHIWT